MAKSVISVISYEGLGTRIWVILQMTFYSGKLAVMKQVAMELFKLAWG